MRVTVGARTGRYGVKPVVTRRREGSTNFVSATTARRAVTLSPKRCTVGVTVAYALSGTPSPTTVPDSYTGRRAAAGAATARAAAATRSTRFMRGLRAT